MPFIQRSLFCFVLCLYLAKYEKVSCGYHDISTREAKSLLEAPRHPYRATNGFSSVYLGKDEDLAGSGGGLEEGKPTDVEDNQILWSEGGRREEVLAVTSTEDSAGGGKRNGRLRISDLGETEKIITVRISSSVARSTYLAGSATYQEKPKLAALQRIGFNVEEPAPKMSASPYVASDFRFRGFLAPSLTERTLPGEIWLRQTTEKPAAASGGEEKYYETRIEAVSSRREIVFGKSDTKSATDAAPARVDYDYYGEPRKEFCELPEANYELPEKNYEVDEAVSLMTDGTSAGEVGSPAAGEGSKLGYVMEGRNFRKYRVEERTPDGFIVGEYGFVRHEDGKLHGVRYTADVTANPRLIYDALMKFLSL